MRRKRVKLTLVIVLVVIVAGIGSVTSYYLGTPTFPGTCNKIIGHDAIVAQSGYSYFCGSGQASDGRLSITYHNYHFAQASALDFIYAPGQQQVLPDEVFLLVNVTVTNIGGGNTSVGGGWTAWVANGSSWAPTTDFFVNASFPNTYPNEVIPDVNGGLYFPPGSTANLWILFYVSFGPNVSSSDINQTSNYQLQYLTFNDQNYGGTYLGHGQENCQQVACTDPMAEPIIQT